jgi:Protein of unknown function (DUF2490)
MKKYLWLFLFLYHGILHAQTSKTDPSDAQGWYAAGIKFDLPKKWTASLDYQARFINNLKKYFGSYISVGVSKKITKQVELMSDYRVARVSKGTYHRFSIGGEATKKIKKFELGLRALIQNQLQDFDDETRLNDNSGYWRTRFNAKYGISKKADVYISIEPVMKFGGRYFVDNWRNTIGIKCKIAKSTKLDAFYIYRPDYSKTYNRTFHIIGLNLDYTLKTAKKKKKNMDR